MSPRALISENGWRTGSGASSWRRRGRLTDMIGRTWQSCNGAVYPGQKSFRNITLSKKIGNVEILETLSKSCFRRKLCFLQCFISFCHSALQRSKRGRQCSKKMILPGVKAKWYRMQRTMRCLRKSNGPFGAMPHAFWSARGLPPLFPSGPACADFTLRLHPPPEPAGKRQQAAFGKAEASRPHSNPFGSLFKKTPLKAAAGRPAR